MANFRMADPDGVSFLLRHFRELDSIGPFYVEALIRPIGLWTGNPSAFRWAEPDLPARESGRITNLDADRSHREYGFQRMDRLPRSPFLGRDRGLQPSSVGCLRRDFGS